MPAAGQPGNEGLGAAVYQPDNTVLVGNQQLVIDKCQPLRSIEPVGHGNHFIGLTIAIAVRQHNDSILAAEGEVDVAIRADGHEPWACEVISSARRQARKYVGLESWGQAQCRCRVGGQGTYRWQVGMCEAAK